MTAMTAMRPMTPLLRAALAVLSTLALGHAQAQTALADQPVFTNIGVPGNLALALSVEFPTVVSVAHTDGTYTATREYLGYFDPNKCYLYQFSANEPDRYFYPAGAATNRTCTGTHDAKWSGNFLNWATMQTIDPFRWALTGGYRVVDTPSLTIIEKARHSGQGGTSNFPNRTLGSAALVANNTPFTWNTMPMRIQGLGNRMRFTSTGNLNNAPTAYNPGMAMTAATTYEVSVRVKVCDADVAFAGPLESNCTRYPAGNYKPTGLMQQYATRIRYSAFGYLNDSNIQRDGGVLRARQKFVGPTITRPGQPDASNPASEWNPDTGVMTLNPDSVDAADAATLFGVPISNSGVMNYLNKFGQITTGDFKSYDPVGELYYAAIRYFKNLGNVPQWTSMGTANVATRTTWMDGFPVITNWDDPIQYSCQKNFVLGIGDVNTHADKNVPGNSPRANEPAKPEAVIADTTVDAVVATNKVGQLHGLGSTLGTTNPINGCCNNNSALMAGIAYDANTRDIRADNNAKPQTLGKQTVQTYWLDVLEYQTYKANNQFYLATKFGGFNVPGSFDPYARTTDLPLEWWSTSGELVGAQPRPDNYYTASRPDQMVAGLTRAFKDIASKISASSSAFATSAPQLASDEFASYAAGYNANNWSGEVTASTTGFEAGTGTPQRTTAWSFSTKLTTQVTGTNWNTARRIATWNTATRTGVPFRLANLSPAQQAGLDTSYRAGNDAGDYLNYLRGDTSNEVGMTTGAQAYRYREGQPVGDIVGARPKVVSQPLMAYSDATNNGYEAFRSQRKTRMPVVYVGANDGKLHAIEGTTGLSTSGREIFAYVPGALYAGANGVPLETGLMSRGNPEFSHRFLVDGPMYISDVDFSKTFGSTTTTPDWRTILVGGLGKGGKAYYALDVTDPTAFTSESAVAGKVLWEFTDPDLGYTYGEPMFTKTAKHGWVVVFGSGYNNTDGKGYLYVVNARTGALLEKIGTGVGSPTAQAGLAHVQTFVLDRTDNTVETVYGGDLLGNLWRFDLRAKEAEYPAPVRIATLTNVAGDALSVTSRPLIAISPLNGRRYVTVGTGRLLDRSDIGSTAVQGFYAFLDGDSNVFLEAADLPSGKSHPLRRQDLLRLTDLTQPIVLDYSTQMGWWFDLGTSDGLGWRVISDPASFNGIIAFPAMVPANDPCSPSGSNRVYAIDLGTGQSKLLKDGVTVAYISKLSGVMTDLRFFSVKGQPVLIGGSDGGLGGNGNGSGEVGRFEGNFGSGTTLRRLNWRELPLAD